MSDIEKETKEVETKEIESKVETKEFKEETKEIKEATNETKEEVEESPEVHFEPVLKLDQIQVKTLEEEEECTFKMRAKLFRYDKGLSEWKERGTGDVRLLKHKKTEKTRLLMRRDKTLKLCANHSSKFKENGGDLLVTEDMDLQPNVGSDRSWVWNVAADMSESGPSSELLAIRFANTESKGF